MSSPLSNRAFHGGRTFFTLLMGQVISTLGAALASFALGIWVYQDTGSVTRFAMIALFTSLPGILALPLAGALVDRFDRRGMMILSEVGAGLGTLGIAGLLGAGALRLWHLYLLLGLVSLFKTFQFPAFTASIALLVPRRHLSRANGLAQMLITAQTAAPILAGFLLQKIGLAGILFFSLGSYVASLLAVATVRIPRPNETGAAAAIGGARSLWSDVAYAWSYLRERPGLLQLLAVFAGTNFTAGTVQALLPPMVLSIASAATLGLVMTCAGAGMVLGTFVMSIWAGPERRMKGIFAALLLQGLILCAAGSRPSVPLIAVAAFLFLFLNPVINGCSQTIWQSKIALEIQGRIFAARRMVALSSLPLAYALAGPLVDGVFEPLLVPGGALAETVGRVIGVGQGRGIALYVILLGLLAIIGLVVAWSSVCLRRLEDQLPDVHLQGNLTTIA